MGRPQRRGIEIESVITVQGDCDITCDVMGDEQIEFWFGPMIDGLHLYFDWPGFVKFMRVAAEMTARATAIPRGQRLEFTVYADERSRKAHGPKY
jgi:hypothetical protein